jgi:hypothetical protein
VRGSENRAAQVALPIGAPSHLELRYLVRADPGGHQRQRPGNQGSGAAEQTGVPLRLRSRDWPAGVAHRRACGAAVGRAGREDLADAAVSDQAAGLCAQLSEGTGRLDRFHTRAACAGARSAQAVQGGAFAVHSGDSGRRQWLARRAGRWNGDKLAGVGLRSGDAHRVRAGRKHRRHAPVPCCPAARILRHSLRFGNRRPTIPGSARAGRLLCRGWIATPGSSSSAPAANSGRDESASRRRWRRSECARATHRQTAVRNPLGDQSRPG